MKYLRFDKTQLNNLEESLGMEILLTNPKGAYHSTTLIDCNTRKYHGLLVMPIPALDDDNHVIISSLDETVIQHGAEFNLAVHRYDNHNFSPNGHKYIREYNVEAVPRTLYRVGGVILAKEKIFARSENRIIIKYTLLDAHSPTILRFKPVMVFRNVNNLTQENENANKNYSEIENGIKTRMYGGYPELFMQFSEPVRFMFHPVWYKNTEYHKEAERGYPYREDLYVPGYFELNIEKGKPVYFSGADAEIAPSTIAETYNKEAEIVIPRTDFFNCLKNAAEQFYYSPKGIEYYIIAGYPWFKVYARDLFIALPGLTLATDSVSLFENIAETAIKALRKFMKTGEPDKIIKNIEQPDTILWAVWALQQYDEASSNGKCEKKYGNFVQTAIDYVMENRHPNLKMDDSGLLYSYGQNQAITWMNSTRDQRPAVPRTGYIVEFNALWYNALKFAAKLSNPKTTKKRIETLETLTEKTAVSFKEKFINEHGYLFDYIDGQHPNWHVRPNMLFAVALKYSPLDLNQQRNVLNIVTRELLTPKGIRSLSPKSEGYQPYCTGPQQQRDISSHHGAAYPWLLGFYLEGYIKLYGKRGIPFVERMLIGLEDEMHLHCIGTLSELFDGNPPFRSRGATSSAINVASILRILKMLPEKQDE
ncbi:MAG: amylo-alpha-1,6-glucosidase [Dysgonamonadaceae bacterium]|nr:amylo-alpha-1,6-glucosidase [Dysgonamonadaceae bacterium]